MLLGNFVMLLLKIVTKSHISVLLVMVLVACIGHGFTKTRDQYMLTYTFDHDFI